MSPPSCSSSSSSSSSSPALSNGAGIRTDASSVGPSSSSLMFAVDSCVRAPTPSSYATLRPRRSAPSLIFSTHQQQRRPLPSNSSEIMPDSNASIGTTPRPKSPLLLLPVISATAWTSGDGILRFQWDWAGLTLVPRWMAGRGGGDLLTIIITFFRHHMLCCWMMMMIALIEVPKDVHPPRRASRVRTFRITDPVD
jgi:hypothetical protein